MRPWPPLSLRDELHIKGGSHGLSMARNRPLLMRITAGHIRRKLMTKRVTPLVPLLLVIFSPEELIVCIMKVCFEVSRVATPHRPLSPMRISAALHKDYRVADSCRIQGIDKLVISLADFTRGWRIDANGGHRVIHGVGAGACRPARRQRRRESPPESGRSRPLFSKS